MEQSTLGVKPFPQVHIFLSVHSDHNESDRNIRISFNLIKKWSYARRLWALIQDKTLSQKVVMTAMNVNTIINLAEPMPQKTSCCQK